MPKGVWIRTEEQMQQVRELGKAPKTEKQREASRKIGRRININGDTIIKHHNDLCHGAERPDDVMIMNHSEHCRLHGKLQCQDRKRDSGGKYVG